MANPTSKIPIILFPLKLETRFVADELWIRVFPDVVFLQSHNPILSGEEKANAIAFNEQASEEQKKQAWEESHACLLLPEVPEVTNRRMTMCRWLMTNDQ